MKREIKVEGWKRAGANAYSEMAFTLIELLAVIAIIGLLAGLVVGLSSLATGKSRAARIKGEHSRLLTAIESYKAEVGNFPPDNADRTKWRDDQPKSYRERAGRNPLFYELSGAVFTNGSAPSFLIVGRDETVTAASLKTELGVGGIENSSRQQREIPFRGITFNKSQYSELKTADNSDVELLAVPIKGPNDLDGKIGKINPWYYDSSSTNRHNGETFDLWTEYLDGQRTNVFGNWKE